MIGVRCIVTSAIRVALLWLAVQNEISCATLEAVLRLCMQLDSRGIWTLLRTSLVDSGG